MLRTSLSPRPQLNRNHCVEVRRLPSASLNGGSEFVAERLYFAEGCARRTTVPYVRSREVEYRLDFLGISSWLTVGRGAMKFVVEVEFPLEPFNTYVRKGSIGEKIGEVLGAIKPEVIYFTDSGLGRGAVMIVELDSAGQAPHITEPFMLTFDASVHYRVAMAPEELQSAGLERYAAT